MFICQIFRFCKKNFIFPEDSSRLEQVLNFLMRAESFLGDAVKAVLSGWKSMTSGFGD